MIICVPPTGGASFLLLPAWLEAAVISAESITITRMTVAATN